MLPSQANKDVFLDIEEVLRILPHRYPFLLVDRILEIEKEKRCVALKNVTYNEPFFQGHFPAYRVMPGVLILEALAQAGGILIHSSLPNPESFLSFLSMVNNAKFRKPVIPGDTLRLEAEMIRFRSKSCHMKGTAFVDGELVAECELMASLLPLKELNALK